LGYNKGETECRDMVKKKYVYLTNNDLWKYGGWENINNKKMTKISKCSGDRDFKNNIYSQQADDIS